MYFSAMKSSKSKKMMQPLFGLEVVFLISRFTKKAWKSKTATLWLLLVGTISFMDLSARFSPFDRVDFNDD